MKYLNKYVRNDIAENWYDIGVELLDAGDEVLLNTIKKNYPESANTCTAQMFSLWLARKPEASWNLLLGVFREPNIQLNTLATKIEGMLYKGTST